jgi:hypothetical protein
VFPRKYPPFGADMVIYAGQNWLAHIWISALL